MEEIEWRIIDGFPDYRISNTGLVESKRKCKRSEIWKPLKLSPDYAGYLTVCLIKGYKEHYVYKVHQLVLNAFVGPKPDNHVTRHLDGNPANNILSNLCWGTQVENMKDSKKHGTFVIHRGTDSTSAKITEKDVIDIREVYANKEMNLKELGEKYKLSQSQIYRIIKRIRWAHVS